ncbi:flavoprotein, partial [Duncaniella muris]|uniref:flavoprotein n=1 Tax=Duncaniella muris TaxID=2094150 RepID=UPI003F73474A
MSALAGKHIILGICGGIAAYKSVSLLRLFVKAGAEVQVVITPAGKQFITPVTLSSLSQKPVVGEFFTANTGEWHSHVDLGLWADCMVIAPATASTIGKMAHGIADNMLVTTYLSAKSKVFVAPAMDFDMMAHPSTTANIDLLRSYGNIIIGPESGELASGLVGKGRVEEPENIFRTVEAYFAAEG